MNAAATFRKCNRGSVRPSIVMQPPKWYRWFPYVVSVLADSILLLCYSHFLTDVPAQLPNPMLISLFADAVTFVCSLGLCWWQSRASPPVPVWSYVSSQLQNTCWWEWAHFVWIIGCVSVADILQRVSLEFLSPVQISVADQIGLMVACFGKRLIRHQTTSWFNVGLLLIIQAGMVLWNEGDWRGGQGQGQDQDQSQSRWFGWCLAFGTSSLKSLMYVCWSHFQPSEKRVSIEIQNLVFSSINMAMDSCMYGVLGALFPSYAYWPDLSASRQAGLFVACVLFNSVHITAWTYVTYHFGSVSQALTDPLAMFVTWVLTMFWTLQSASAVQWVLMFQLMTTNVLYLQGGRRFACPPLNPHLQADTGGAGASLVPP